ncbi:MAG: phosphate/phosphite/phosphonate ABC transporter substrate-binding protein [Pseudomonas sp.]
MRLTGWVVGLLAALLWSEVLATEAVECRHDSLRISLIPVKNMGRLTEDYRPLADLLSTGLRMPVRILHASSYQGVMDAVISGGTDVARLGPASYLQAWKSNPAIEPFASLAPEPGYFSTGGSYYSSLLLARGDGARRSIEDLRGQLVALNDPASTSGALIPRHEFAALVGEPLVNYFSGLIYAGSHDRALDALLKGRVEAAFVSSERADEYLAQGLITENSLRVLWRSEPIHYDPLVFSGVVCEELKQRIRQLMTTPSPELSEFLRNQRAERVVPVTHDTYHSLLRRIGE